MGGHENQGEAPVAPPFYETWRVGSLGLLALLMLVPVTLPVPVLRELVQERFGVSEFLTSLFMSINMIGAVFAAPLAGAIADRFGRRPDWIGGALLLDSACFFALTFDLPFTTFMAIRFVEGCAHIFALSLLLALASTARPTVQRGSVMGMAGAGLLLGVAIGAPVGGALGQDDPLVPLQVGSGLLLFAALLARLTLRETTAGGEARPSLSEIVATVRSSPLVLGPLAFAFADRFTVGFFTTTFSLYLKRIHDLPPPAIGLMIAVFMLPFALLSYPFGWVSQRMSRAILLCGGSLIYGIGTASLTLWSPETLPFFMAALGATAALMFVPSMLMTTDVTPESVRSTSLGAFNAAGSLGFIVGPATGGFVSQWVAQTHGWEAGYRAAFQVAGASEVLLAVAIFPILWRWERRHRSSP